jgi:transposase
MSEVQSLDNSRLLQHLLPVFFCLKIISWSINETENQLTIKVKTQNIQAVCPICNSTSDRLHSSYQRSLDDVSWGNYQVCLKLSTQKFFCTNSNCERRIFTIRWPEIAAPWARRTERLNTQLIKVGLAQGGLPGARLTILRSFK